MAPALNSAVNTTRACIDSQTSFFTIPYTMQLKIKKDVEVPAWLSVYFDPVNSIMRDLVAVPHFHSINGLFILVSLISPNFTGRYNYSIFLHNHGSCLNSISTLQAILRITKFVCSQYWTIHKLPLLSFHTIQISVSWRCRKVQLARSSFRPAPRIPSPNKKNGLPNGFLL